MLTLINVLPKLASSAAIMPLMCISCCFSSGNTSPIIFTTTPTSLDSEETLTKAYHQQSIELEI